MILHIQYGIKITTEKASYKILQISLLRLTYFAHMASTNVLFVK